MRNSKTDIDNRIKQLKSLLGEADSGSETKQKTLLDKANDIFKRTKGEEVINEAMNNFLCCMEFKQELLFLEKILSQILIR